MEINSLVLLSGLSWEIGESIVLFVSTLKDIPLNTLMELRELNDASSILDFFLKRP